MSIHSLVVIDILNVIHAENPVVKPVIVPVAEKYAVNVTTLPLQLFN